MREFSYNANAARVIFGAGRIAALGEELDRLGLKRVLVLSTPEQENAAHAATAIAGPRLAGHFAGAVMHTPVEVTEKALVLVRDLAIDGVVSFGGGSRIGLGKALALRTDLPQLAIPTTYAGSEMTPILGETENGRKVTQTTVKVLPETVIYDVGLTLGLPGALSGTSGINAIAHAVEALYAQNRNPVISLMAAEGVRALAAALPRVIAAPDDSAAQTDALYGAWLCGMCLGAVRAANRAKPIAAGGGQRSRERPPHRSRAQRRDV